jgi:ribonuclease D
VTETRSKPLNLGRAGGATLVDSDAALRGVVAQFIEDGARLSVDLESNGLFKYKATLCTLQIANVHEVVVVDTIAAPLGPLVDLLGPRGPRKIVHDVSFDARILAEGGVVLGNVLDTSIAARMLGRTATGLASLLESELGIKVDKRLQHHDWTERPIRDGQLHYLVEDVAHLEALADKLWAEVEDPARAAHGVGDAIEEETRYRIAQAGAAIETVDPRPPYLRLKGIERVPPEDLPILRRLADLREAKAKSLDVPPYKVIGPDVLLTIARARPRTLDALLNVKGVSGGRARSLAASFVEAVTQGVDEGEIPEAERAMLARPRIPPAVVKARRTRENLLTSWRKKTAKERGVDEQVILPGHCLQDLADLAEETISLETIATIPGIGVFRVERDGGAIALVLSARGREPRPQDDEVAPS